MVIFILMGMMVILTLIPWEQKIQNQTQDFPFKNVTILTKNNHKANNLEINSIAYSGSDL